VNPTAAVRALALRSGYAAVGDGHGGTLVAGQASEAAERPALLPDDLVASGKLRRKVVELGQIRRRVYRYEGVSIPSSSAKAVVYTMPLKTGVAMVACVAGDVAFVQACDSAAARVRVVGAEVMSVGPNPGLGAEIKQTRAALSTAPAGLRSREPRRQAAAATALRREVSSRAQAQSRLELGPADRQLNADLATAVTRVSSALRVLSDAAGRRDTRRHRSARGQLESAYRTARAVLKRARLAGYDVDAEVTAPRVAPVRPRQKKKKVAATAPKPAASVTTPAPQTPVTPTPQRTAPAPSTPKTKQKPALDLDAD
jgi:hypothetical protein